MDPKDFTHPVRKFNEIETENPNSERYGISNILQADSAFHYFVDIPEVFDIVDNANCSFTTEVSANSFLNNPGHLSEIMSKSILEITGKNSKPELATDGGTSDARFIKDYCEVAELGIRNQSLHKVDEFVYLSDIRDLQKIYLRIIENYFNKN